MEHPTLPKPLSPHPSAGINKQHTQVPVYGHLEVWICGLLFISLWLFMRIGSETLIRINLEYIFTKVALSHIWRPFSFCKTRFMINTHQDDANRQPVAIQLTNGQFTLIDAEDYEKVSPYKWRVDKQGYAVATIKHQFVSLHRLVMSAEKGVVIDHEDLDKLNNQKYNLRLCTLSENGKNYPTPKSNTSGFKGVHWYKYRSTWRARIGVDGKRVDLGYFKCKIEAAKAYNEASIKFHGEFGRLNEIP